MSKRKQDFSQLFNPERKRAWLEETTEGALDVVVQSYWRVLTDYITPSEKRFGKDLLEFNVRSEMIDLMCRVPLKGSPITKALAVVRSYLKWALNHSMINMQEYVSHPFAANIFMSDIVDEISGNRITFVKDADHLVTLADSVLEPDQTETADVKFKCVLYAGFMGMSKTEIINVPMSEFSMRAGALGEYKIPEPFKSSFFRYYQMTGENRYMPRWGETAKYYYANDHYFFRNARKNPQLSETNLPKIPLKVAKLLNELPGQKYSYEFDLASLSMTPLFQAFRMFDIGLPNVSRNAILSGEFIYRHKQVKSKYFLTNYLIWLSRYYPEEVHSKDHFRRLSPNESIIRSL